VTTSDAEWDDEARAAAMGLALFEDTLCPLCKRPSYICQDVDNQFNWRPRPPTRCHATSAVLAQQQGFTEETNPQAGALLFGAQLKTKGGASSD
jgi:hypothetical protein